MRALYACFFGVFAIGACASNDHAKPSIARVSQATIDDGSADAQFGQPDFVTSIAQPPGAPGVSSPRGMSLEPSAVFFPGSSNLVWVADSEYNRTFGVDATKFEVPSDLMGQTLWTASSPDAGGPVTGNAYDHPFDISHVYGDWLVSDTNNHRVLVGRTGSFGPNDVLGQKGSFSSNIRNLGGTSADSLAEPKAATLVSDPSFGLVVAVADSGNNRVLLYFLGSHTANWVAGQNDFAHGLPNMGATASPESLNDPHDVERSSPYDPSQIADPRRSGFFVADTGNNRVLRFRTCATTSCGRAIEVYGQPDLLSSSPGVGPDRLNAPSAIALDPNGGFWVADTGNNRVVHFKIGSKTADRVLGQPDLLHGDPPASVSASTLSAPEGVAVAPTGDVFVSDTGANRILKYAFVPSPDACDDGDPCTDDSIATNGCQHFLTSESTACRPYACDTVNRVCFPDCAHGPCDAPWICTGFTCALPCVDPSACASGFCVDGWCCDAACDGTCEACNVPGSEGKCSAFAGLPQARRPASSCFSPNGSLECGGQCDGIRRDACKPRVAGATCGARSCTFGREKSGGTCDGAGSCMPASRDCFPYACGPAACRTECVGDDECAAGARCIDGGCIDEQRAVTSVGGSCATSFAESEVGPFALFFAWLLVARRRRSRS